MYEFRPYRDQKNIRRARELRREMTAAEKVLWSALRNRKLGVKFRRQVPLGRFIADFLCYECRLVIEVDGGIHEQQKKYDNDRQAEIEKHGLHVLRFRNEEVMQDLERVLAVIVNALTPDPSPTNPPTSPERGDLQNSDEKPSPGGQVGGWERAG